MRVKISVSTPSGRFTNRVVDAICFSLEDGESVLRYRVVEPAGRSKRKYVAIMNVGRIMPKSVEKLVPIHNEFCEKNGCHSLKCGWDNVNKRLTMI